MMIIFCGELIIYNLYIYLFNFKKGSSMWTCGSLRLFCSVTFELRHPWVWEITRPTEGRLVMCG